MMLMNLGGIVPLSTVDWLGRAAMVVFLRGCPLSCPNCHNFELRTGDSSVTFHSAASRIVSQLKGERSILPTDAPKRKMPIQINLDEASDRAFTRPLVDAFVLSGGEPLVQPEACSRLFQLARGLGLSTGLETSGFYPDRLEALLQKDLVDRIFLDLKAPLKEPSYSRATGTGSRGVAARVHESLRICLEHGAPLDVRTTVFPDAPSLSEVVEIAGTLLEMTKEHPSSHLECFVLQQGQPRECGPAFSPVHVQLLQDMALEARKLVKVRVRAPPKIAWKAK
ncbi:7-carboxy-7-deazaguanine synthase [uncultured archaeon]|nr:7-carboxy-7-deazaguanine synthase [uncultured archaeon]